MNPAPLTPEQVRWIAHLARLELTEVELNTMTPQLGAIVEYVAQLQSAGTDDVEPLAHALPVSNVFRDDDPAPSLPIEQAVVNAPDSKKTAKGDQFFGVPAVLE